MSREYNGGRGQSIESALDINQINLKRVYCVNRELELATAHRSKMSVSFSDSELSKRLQRLGVDVGPITDTTRDVYWRRYQTLLAQQPKQRIATPPRNRPGESPCTSSIQPTTPPHSPSTSATPPNSAPPPGPANEGNSVAGKGCWVQYWAPNAVVE